MKTRETRSAARNSAKSRPPPRGSRPIIIISEPCDRDYRFRENRGNRSIITIIIATIRRRLLRGVPPPRSALFPPDSIPPSGHSRDPHSGSNRVYREPNIIGRNYLCKRISLLGVKNAPGVFENRRRFSRSSRDRARASATASRDPFPSP